MDQERDKGADSFDSGPSPESQQHVRTVTERSRGWKRRTAKACDACRKRKIRCDGLRPVCSRCSLNGIGCVYADYEKEGPVRRVRGPSYVQQLEQRLRHVETKLGNANEEGDEPPRGRPREEQPMPGATAAPVGTSPQDSEDLDSQSSVLARGRTGDMRYFGPQSSVSILSTNGLRWIASHTRDPSVHRSLRTTLDEECRWTNWTHPILQETVRRESTWPLPPWNEALALVEEYFEHYHKALPIFHQPTFMSLLNQQYTRDSIKSPGWWASLNAVLAIAQRRRIEQSPETSDKDIPWFFAKNALDVVLELLMLNTSLSSVQALIALSMYFLGTPNPQPSFFLASAAVRISHAIGLHDPINLPSISAFEREQRQQVFWCAVIADQATSFRTGRPPAQPLHNSKIELPESVIGDTYEVRNAEGNIDTIDLFHFSAWMSKIQAKIYHRLYSPSTTGRSEAEITMAVLELDELLREWSQALPLSVRPGHSMEAWSNPVNIDMARLHLDYHHCVITIHRMKAYRNGGIPKNEEDANPKQKPDPLRFLFSERCMEAAKQSIEVLGIMPEKAESFFWGATHFPLSIFVVLFINKLPHPIKDPEELRAAEILVNYVSRFSGEHIESHGHLFLAIMKELLKATRITTGRANEHRAPNEQNSTHRASNEQSSAHRRSVDQSSTHRGSIDRGSIHRGSVDNGSTETASNFSHHSQEISQQLSPAIPIDTPGQQWASTCVPERPAPIQNLSASSLQTMDQQGGLNPIGNAMYTMPPVMNYGMATANNQFEGQDAWEALVQMPFPFPWNWQDLPFDAMQDIETYQT